VCSAWTGNKKNERVRRLVKKESDKCESEGACELEDELSQ
jgi:hypothetical protein